MEFKQITECVEAEIKRARKLFPENVMQVQAMNEEVGEFNKALLENWYGKDSDADVFKEGIQAIAMIYRVLLEGDPAFKYKPDTDLYIKYPIERDKNDIDAATDILSNMLSDINQPTFVKNDGNKIIAYSPSPLGIDDTHFQGFDLEINIIVDIKKYLEIKLSYASECLGRQLMGYESIVSAVGHDQEKLIVYLKRGVSIHDKVDIPSLFQNYTVVQKVIGEDIFPAAGVTPDQHWTKGTGLTTDRNDPDLHVKKDNGQYKKHIVTENTGTYIRPIRTKYIHDTCGVETVMGEDIAKTYAKDPTFYGSTFCVGTKCKDYFPVGEFKWSDTEDRVGS